MLTIDQYPPSRQSWKHVLARLPEEKQQAFLDKFKEEETNFLETDFWLNARREQLPPLGDWYIWVIMAGRGFGKTFAGANWLIEQHKSEKAKNSAIIAATSADLRRYCIEGPSGVLAQAPSYFQPVYIPSKTRLEWPDGAMTHLYTSEKPNRLRGANHDVAWCDELSYWAYARDVWDMLMLTLRYGNDPKCVVTMTPRPIPLVRELLGRNGQDVTLTTGSTYDNKANLSKNFIHQMDQRYKGTRLGRQEIEGEILLDAEGALWTHSQFDEPSFRLFAVPELIRVVVGLDPAITSGESADEAGIVIAGKCSQGLGHVLGDHSLRGTPYEWAKKSIDMYHHYGANCIVAEKNQGGEMITTIIHNIDRGIPVKLVHASVGKVARAEPVAVEYERGRVFHHGNFFSLEDEMCSFVPGETKESPNRLDALVWAMTDLIVKPSRRGGAWGRKKEKEIRTKVQTSDVPLIKERKKTFRFGSFNGS